jgi:hypothetical protein
MSLRLPAPAEIIVFRQAKAKTTRQFNPASDHRAPWPELTAVHGWGCRHEVTRLLLPMRQKTRAKNWPPNSPPNRPFANANLNTRHPMSVADGKTGVPFI